jgi:BirA family biotin operon repressor/biotin-[acetyl-CoA-carboxylase] ligase
METVALPAGLQLISVGSVDSTNEEAKRLADDGAPNGTVVWAREQTAGRGRYDRTWVSRPGNLFFSILLRPDCSLAMATQIGFVAANAVAEAIAAHLPLGTQVGCKWPNDVLIGGRKVSGILLEVGTDTSSGVEWLVVGVGVNVDSHPAAAYPATSLAAEGATGASAGGLLVAICKSFVNGLEPWQTLGFSEVRREWLRRAVGIGQPITVRMGKETHHGVFEEMDADGALILRHKTGLRRITAGDVFPAVPSGDTEEGASCSS